MNTVRLVNTAMEKCAVNNNIVLIEERICLFAKRFLRSTSLSIHLILKTLLRNVHILCCFLAGTIVKGEILVNNRPIGPFMHRYSGFVHQDDLFNGSLTVLEHMSFMVNETFSPMSEKVTKMCTHC